MMDTHCPDCGCEGCSPDCPGPAWAPCISCGGNAAIRDGVAQCDSCGSGYPPGSMFDTDPESAANRRFTGR